MLITLSTALLAAFIFGNLLRVHQELASLVGVGTGICGGAAIAAIAPIIQADDSDIAFAISTVFLYCAAANCQMPQREGVSIASLGTSAVMPVALLFQ